MMPQIVFGSASMSILTAVSRLKVCLVVFAWTLVVLMMISLINEKDVKIFICQKTGFQQWGRQTICFCS
jgi:hypothetical protein